MDDVGKALLIVLSIDVFLILLQIAVLSINHLGASHFYNYQGSAISNYDSGSNYTLDLGSTTNRLPDAAGVTASDTNIFTDAWNTIKGWLLDVPGVGYLLQIISGPSSFLKMLNFPAELSFALGALWYGLTLFLIVAWGLGRTQ